MVAEQYVFIYESSTTVLDSITNFAIFHRDLTAVEGAMAGTEYTAGASRVRVW